MNNNFDDVVFPSRLAFGIDAIVETRVDVTRLASGHEHRNTRWSRPRRRYTLSIDQRPVSEVRDLMAFYEARRGPLNAFKFRDPLNHSTANTGQPINAKDVILGEGDGTRTEFELREFSGRPVTMPDAASLLVGQNGLALNSGFQLNLSGHLVFDVAPAQGVIITAGFAFFIPVRFENDELVATRTTNATAEIAQINLVEVHL